MTFRAPFIAAMIAIIPTQSAIADVDRQDFVEALFDAFNDHDVETLKTFYSEDAVVYSPESCEPTIGREAIGEGYSQMFQQIPDVHDALEVAVTDGNKTAVIFTASSKIQGAEFELPISAFLTIEDGLIVEDRAFFDTDMEMTCGR